MHRLILFSLTAAFAGCSASSPTHPDDGGPGDDASPCAGFDTATDPDHCGACETSCASVAHAPRACVAGRCTRGPCETGRFDLDGELATGCEATCDGATCTVDHGGTVEFTSPPLSETGLVLSTASSGGAFGASAMSAPAAVLEGLMGEPATGALPSSISHVLQPGFAASTTR